MWVWSKIKIDKWYVQNHSFTFITSQVTSRMYLESESKEITEYQARDSNSLAYLVTVRTGPGEADLHRSRPAPLTMEQKRRSLSPEPPEGGRRGKDLLVSHSKHTKQVIISCSHGTWWGGRNFSLRKLPPHARNHQGWEKNILQKPNFSQFFDTLYLFLATVLINHRV